MAGGFSSTVNNPRTSWLEYLGLPEDFDEWTLVDVKDSVSSYLLPAGEGAAATTSLTGHEERTLTLADFADYNRRIGQPYRFMAAHRPQPKPDGAASSSNGAAGDAADAPPDAQMADLSMVPDACFRDDFELSRPSTFAQFSPPDQTAAVAMVTLEKLGNYLDAVELNLLSEVSRRSEGFFDALSSYETLTREVAEGCKQIEAMRAKLRSLEANLVRHSLRLPTLVRRRVNTAALLEKLRLVHAVWATQPTIQQLLTARDFGGALELISSSQQLLSTELSGVSSLRRLGGSLAATKRRITTIMSQDLLQLALGYELEAGPPAHPVEALASELDQRLLPLACGLMRLRLLHEAIQSLEEQMLRDVRTLVKKKLQEQIALHDQGGAAAPAAAPAAEAAAAPAEEGAAAKPARTVMVQVRELSTSGFEAVMSGVSSALMVLLRRAALIHASILKATVSPAGKAAAAAAAASAASASSSAGLGGGGAEAEDDGSEYIRQVESLSGELLQHVCELSQERYARLLKVRKESHSRLKLVDFVKMNASVNEFVRDVDHLCKRPFSVLGAELQAHAAEFLRVAHEAATRKLEALVETEPWKQVDVAPEFQDIADSFVHHQVPQLAESELERLREHEAPAESAGTPREILVEGVGYKVVGSSLLLLTMIAHYMQCVAALQTVGPQVAHLAPALLKLFHTLCYKQVLMAGAMRPESAGLKSITFKHLALASQSLGLFLGLMPHLKAILAAYLPEAQRALLREADSAIADYERHQQELFSKFVSILEERRRTHVSTLADALAPSEDRRRPEPSACIKAVAKDIVSMHKQLQPLLSRQQLHTVFVQVLHAFDGGLLGSYKALDTSALFTRQCIVADVLYLRQEVTRLHLALPKGVCPDLIEFAKSLDVSG